MRIDYGITSLKLLNSSISIALDTETTQLRAAKGCLRLIQLASVEADVCVVIDVWSLTDQGLEELGRFFNTRRTWIAHNMSFDCGFLQAQGWNLRGQLRCTMLADKLVRNGKKSIYTSKLADVVKLHLGEEVDKTEQTSDWSAKHLTESQLEYAAKDACLLPELDAVLARELTRLHLDDAYELECRAIPAISQMQRIGIPWNRSMLEEQRDNYVYDIEKASADFYMQFDEALPDGEKLPRFEDGSFNLNKKQSGSLKNPKRWGPFQPVGFNIGSPAQLQGKLAYVFGHIPKNPKTGKPSADKATLKQYESDYPFVTTYLEWKRLEKRRQMVEGMLDAMDSAGFVASSYMQWGALTGRMTSSKPNMQQQPRDPEFRSCAVAPEGYVFVDADYQAAELRIAAAVSGDETMTQYFVEGVDIHQATADELGCDRQIAKSANFSLLYGGGPKALKDYAAVMGVELSLDRATEIRKQWLKKFSTIAKWQRANSKIVDEAEPDMLAFVRIPGSNAIRYLPDEEHKLTNRCNTPCQGVGAAMLKVALGNLWEHLEQWGDSVASVAAVVHDEILLLVKEERAEEVAKVLTECMEWAEAQFLGDVPSEAEAKIGKDWASCH